MRSLSIALAFAVLSTSAFGQSSPRVAKALPAPKSVAEDDGASPSGGVVLRANDTFELRLSGMPPDDALQFGAAPLTIANDGTVTILYAGKIQAAGKSPTELERAIEKELIDKKIFRWPNATINVATALRNVTVGGNVRNPNRLSWTSDLTLGSAITAAQGPSDFAGDKINLIRGGKVYQYSYKKLKRDPSQDPKLLPGDQVDLL